jgi:hypothetical protein
MVDARILKGVVSATLSKNGFSDQLVDIELLDILSSHPHEVAV